MRHLERITRASLLEDANHQLSNHVNNWSDFFGFDFCRRQYHLAVSLKIARVFFDYVGHG